MNYLWNTKPGSKKTSDFIHQTLAFGTLSDIKSLKRTVGEEKLTSIFLKNPKKIYNARLFNFIKNIVLDIHTSVDEKKYLKYAPRNIG